MLRICGVDSQETLCHLGDDLAVLWDADTGDALRVCKGHSGEVNSVDLSYKGRFAITGGCLLCAATRFIPYKKVLRTLFFSLGCQ